MKKIMKVGFCLLLGLFIISHSVPTAAAEDSMACGIIEQGKNPSQQTINCLLTNAALKEGIPPEVVKAIAAQESGWKQFNDNGEASISIDGGIGLMQITNHTDYDQEKLKTDILYNIYAGINILKSMFARTDLPKIIGANSQVLENWYFPILAYNGTKPVNSPTVQSTGEINNAAYQEIVLHKLMDNSFLGERSLASIPFKKEDFLYNPDSNDNIIFNVLSYAVPSELHETIYTLKKGDNVITTTDNVKLRKGMNTSSSLLKLAKNTPLLIDGNFVYDSNPNSFNQFVWYPVKTADKKLVGYISSAYITTKVGAPFVNTVADYSKAITGKSLAYASVSIKKGSSIIGTGVSDEKGNFRINVAPQKAGTKLAVVYTNYLHALSEAKTITVADKTAPSAPKLDTVTSVSKTVTGKAEANSTITLSVNKKTIGTGKADKAGKFKISIKQQKANTKIYASAKDSAKNTSKSSYTKVLDKTAPSAPALYKVTSKTKTVTGKSEAYSAITLKVNNKTIGTGKTDKAGKFKITIKLQKVKTKIYATAADSSKNISKSSSITVVK
ncbi:Ig-like domain-containing protein [Niallia sp. 03133]|uniref:Ig-like domain-containing protein n=1 Tax=Niallia sp. 03133 TaxID=3458060 RepID=UPI004044CD79